MSVQRKKLIIPQSKRLALPDSEILYVENWLTTKNASELQCRLKEELDWRQGEVVVFGKRHRTPRLQAWHGDSEVRYRYSGVELAIQPWTRALSELRVKLADINISSNAVLANLYRNGSDRMGWHSDNERELGPHPVIASVSLGAERDFLLRHKLTDEQYKINLAHGSLFVMAGDTQRYWHHSLPVRKRVDGERINLTFRQIFG